MELKEVERIKDLINKNEIEKAKAQGVKEKNLALMMLKK